MTAHAPDAASVSVGLRRQRRAPPARIVHLGLGAFSRSHVAWYTARAFDADQWGIVAYTGRSSELALALAAQDGVYTLVERSAEDDRATVIESIVRAHPGDDVDALRSDLAAPTTAIVTLTITEAGYRAGADGAPDDSDPLVAADRRILERIGAGDASAAGALQTAIGRLVCGLDARRRGGGGPVAIVSCDNLPDNGGRTARVLLGLAASIPETAEWCRTNVSFVSGSVDRITPRLSESELVRLSETYQDAAPVVAEPFSDWVISGGFPAGRPAWETAGARFADELEPWEARKLWMLNGAHTLLASLGLLRGHRVVSESIADPECRRAVELLWDDAVLALPSGIEVDDYRSALVERFANPRIEHPLAQIAEATTTKVRLRIVPVAEHGLEHGRTSDGSAVALAAWIVATRRGIVPAAGLAPTASVVEMLASVSDALPADDAFVGRVADAVAAIEALPSG